MTTKDDDIKMIGEKLVFNPYNPVNKEITLNEVQSILSNYGVPNKVDNLELYNENKILHKSYVKRPFLENEQENIVVVEKPYVSFTIKRNQMKD